MFIPADNTNTASSWIVLTSATSAGDTTLGNVTVTGNIDANNVANYLSNYRMMNDYISVQVANVIDLSITIDVVLDSSQNQIQHSLNYTSFQLQLSIKQ